MPAVLYTTAAARALADPIVRRCGTSWKCCWWCWLGFEVGTAAEGPEWAQRGSAGRARALVQAASPAGRQRCSRSRACLMKARRRRDPLRCGSLCVVVRGAQSKAGRQVSYARVLCYEPTPSMRYTTGTWHFSKANVMGGVSSPCARLALTNRAAAPKPGGGRAWTTLQTLRKRKTTCFSSHSPALPGSSLHRACMEEAQGSLPGTSSCQTSQVRSLRAANTAGVSQRPPGVPAMGTIM